MKTRDDSKETASPTDPVLLSEGEMFCAVESRDSSHDERFVYGVVTTGIFCRPSCAARTPKPENIRYFLNSSSACTAGFRACKRCRPTAPSLDVFKMAKIAKYIDTHANEKLTLNHLSDVAGLSSAHLQRLFTKAIGVSPKQYQASRQRDLFTSALKTGSSVTTATQTAGYGSTSRVTSPKGANIGMTPTNYRLKGQGETIAWTYRNSPLGGLMMGATERGVCFVQFGQSQSELLEALSSEFSNATLTRPKDSEELTAWMDALQDYLEQRAPCPELPLDLQGTAFQMLVWKFLLDIPDGQVVSYSDVAKGIERQSAVRAAATACGANRIAILVPCHRVLRATGALGGYRWGLDRKRALLELER